ncbi:MAG: hypothetical protein HY549_07510 [Elusimicrobia bacterium]|nr:hypothetical protein [Elusimicrobiota bacterium]
MMTLKLLLAATVACAGAPSSKLEVVIKGEDQRSLSMEKPLFDIPFDPYENVRPSLQADPSLLMAQSPVLSTALTPRPPILRNIRMLTPANQPLVGEGQTFHLRVRRALEDSLGRSLRDDGAQIAWTLNIIDENGQPFERFEGRGVPPEEISWNGRSRQGRWLVPGHDYSAVFVFNYGKRTPVTILGQPLRYPALTHKEPDGTVISLDSSLLFGPSRDQIRLVNGEGSMLLRAAADFIRRRAHGSPIELRLWGAERSALEPQARALREFLAGELMLAGDSIATLPAAASPAEARLDLFLKRAR